MISPKWLVHKWVWRRYLWVDQGAAPIQVETDFGSALRLGGLQTVAVMTRLSARRFIGHFCNNNGSTNNGGRGSSPAPILCRSAIASAASELRIAGHVLLAHGTDHPR